MTQKDKEAARKAWLAASAMYDERGDSETDRKGEFERWWMKHVELQSKTPELLAREMLARLGLAEYRTNGDIVELAKLINIARAIRLKRYNVRTEIGPDDRKLFDKLAVIVDAIEFHE